MESIVAEKGGLNYGKIGTSISRLVNAGKLREIMLPIFEKTPDLAIKRLSDSTYIWE
jgi:hypothetical protein